jgi:transposase InsO family protein
LQLLRLLFVGYHHWSLSVFNRNKGRTSRVTRYDFFNTLTNFYPLRSACLWGRSQLIQRMSSSGNCWDEASAESFFATLKKQVMHSEFFAAQ